MNEQIFPVEAKLNGEMIYWLTKLAVLEYLTSGITAVFDMYLTPETIADACVDMGMRCVQVGGVNNFSQSAELVEKMFQELNKKHLLLSYQIGFHAEYTCSRELLERISALAHQYKAPVYAHLSETESEVDACRKQHGMTPPVYLDSLGMFDYGGGGYHCVHMTEADMEIFQKRGLYAIDLRQPNMQPVHNIPKNIVYSGSKQNVKMTMINGRILYENGKFADFMDVDGIYAKAEEIKQKIID